MSPEDRAGYEKLLAEMKVIALRLYEISDGGYADMEGADNPEFHISEVLWADLKAAAYKVADAHKEIRATLDGLQPK